MSENVDDVFSDEDLPDILENNNESGPEETEIYKGAIVWAEFRKIYWPALVRSVNKRNRKACVWYLDSPKKCFKLPFNKILSFHDKKVNDKIKEEAKNSPMKEHHDKVLNRTLTYLHRKSLGINDDPADYFDFEKPYFALCLSSASENTDKNNKTGIVQNTEESDDDDDNDDDEDSAESIPDDEMITDFRNSLCETDDSVEDEVVNSLVDCIKMGNTNEHLLQVRFGKIPSTWRAAYDEAVKTNLKKLWYIDAYGPVKNFEKLKEICLYLLNFYEKVVESGKCEMTAYVMSVWLPESITKAISIVKKVSLETARELFLNNHKIETTTVKRELIFSTAGEVSNEAVNQFSDKISPSTAEILTTESTHSNASQKVEDTTDSSFNKDLSSSKLDRKTNITSKVLSSNSECELTGNKASSSVRRKKATKKRKTAWSRGILPKIKKKSKIA